MINRLLTNTWGQLKDNGQAISNEDTTSRFPLKLHSYFTIPWEPRDQRDAKCLERLSRGREGEREGGASVSKLFMVKMDMNIERSPQEVSKVVGASQASKGMVNLRKTGKCIDCFQNIFSEMLWF